MTKYEYKPLRSRLIESLYTKERFTLAEAYEVAPEKPHTTIRGRINEAIGTSFERLSKGVYRVVRGEAECLLYQGDGRHPGELGIKEGSIDLIINDYAWEDTTSNKGGNRNFATYDCFKYELSDFIEKAKLLKDGHFLVEILPAENENNFEELYRIKKLAIKAGFTYYSCVDWKKGKFVANTGRKAKNTEQVMIFVKGKKARAMRPDVKKDKAEPEVKHFMSGSAKMLPACFDFEPPKRDKKIHQSEKPVALYEELIDLLSFPGETVLDQYAGSGAVGEAALNKNRKCILIEICKEFVDKIVKRLGMVAVN